LWEPSCCLSVTPPNVGQDGRNIKQNNSTEQSPSWEANSFSPLQEIFPISCNPKFHHRIYNSKPSFSYQSQINPFHAYPAYFLKFYFNIIAPYKPRFPKWFLFLSGIPTKTLYAPILPTISATSPAHLILLDLIPRTIFGEYRSLSSSLCSFRHSPVTWSLLGPNILLSTLFSNTLNLRSSLNMRDQVSHPYKTKGEISVLYILTIIMFMDCKLKDKRFPWIKSALNFFVNGIFIS